MGNPTPPLRHTPHQARAKHTLELIEEAARNALVYYGRDRFTTAQVAEISGQSIGTIYRYFPDRVAILDRVWPGRESPFPADYALDASEIEP